MARGQRLPWSSAGCPGPTTPSKDVDSPVGRSPSADKPTPWPGKGPAIDYLGGGGGGGGGG